MEHPRSESDDNSAAQPTSYEIGSAELDLASRQLRFDGQAVDVQPKVFDLLEYLVRHRDRVVSKDELFDEVWPNVVVSDASLSQTIKRARDLFRSQGFEQDIIRTVARRGYQFDHPVVVSAAASAGPDALAPTREGGGFGKFTLYAFGFAIALALALLWPREERVEPAPTVELAAPTIQPNSLAVLPFKNLTPDVEFAYFSDGLTETLINNLATVKDLRVIARTSAYRASRQASDPGAIAADLHVAYLLQGSVQRDGDMLRINTRLVRAADDSPLWSQQYNYRMDDVFAVQDAISQSVIRELSLILDTDLGAPRTLGLVESAGTAEAFELSLRATRERRRGSRESVLAAAELFREALARDPNFSPALVGLSEAMRWLGVTGTLPRSESFTEALTLVEQAVRVTPDNGLAYLQLAELQHRHFWDFAGASASFEQAVALMPASGEVYSAYSRFLAKAGESDGALVSAREAVDMNPRSENVYTNLVLRLIKADELEEARRAIDALKTLNEDNPDIPWLETNWHLRSGSYREALQWITLEELDHLRLSLSAVTLQRLGRTAQAEEMLSELIETDATGSAFQIAETYAQWGDIDDAFAWLQRALENGDPGLIELYSSLNLENLYGDARFAPLAERVGMPAPPPGS